MVRSPPDVCRNGHQLQETELSPTGWSISGRGHCWLCRDQHKSLSAGGRAGGKKSKRAQPDVPLSNGNAWRSARTIYKDTTPVCTVATVLFIEVCAGAMSQFARAAAFVGSKSLRIIWSKAKLQPRIGPNVFVETQTPTLSAGVAATWLLDLARRSCRSKLLSFVEACVSSGVYSRVVLLTSPACTPWCGWKTANYVRAAKAGIVAKRTFLKRRRAVVAAGVSQIRFVRRLLARAFAIRHRHTQLVRIHEQSDRSRMPVDGVTAAYSKSIETETP